MTSPVLPPQEMNPEYLEQYYTTAPPGVDKSWLQLDALAQASAGFNRFTSPSMHVRVFASTAILYHVSVTALVAGLPGCCSACTHRCTQQEIIKVWGLPGQQQTQKYST
jgi:hypothetical protein